MSGVIHGVLASSFIAPSLQLPVAYVDGSAAGANDYKINVPEVLEGQTAILYAGWDSLVTGPGGQGPQNTAWTLITGNISGAIGKVWYRTGPFSSYQEQVGSSARRMMVAVFANAGLSGTNTTFNGVTASAGGTSNSPQAPGLSTLNDPENSLILYMSHSAGAAGGASFTSSYSGGFVPILNGLLPYRMLERGVPTGTPSAAPSLSMGTTSASRAWRAITIELVSLAP